MENKKEFAKCTLPTSMRKCINEEECPECGFNSDIIEKRKHMGVRTVKNPETGLYQVQYQNAEGEWK